MCSASGHTRGLGGRQSVELIEPGWPDQPRLIKYFVLPDHKERTAFISPHAAVSSGLTHRREAIAIERAHEGDLLA